MKMNRKFRAAFAVASLLWAGCSHSGRTISPVRGQVTYQKKPVAGATVTFLCPGAPRMAVGTTDENGNYQLTTFQPNDGAIVGTHVVTVNIYTVQPDAVALGTGPTSTRKGMSTSIDDAMKRSVQQIKKTEKAKPLIPPKYGDRRTSDLHKDVVKGNNVINIDLTD